MPDWRTDPSSAGAAIARVSLDLKAAGLADAGLDSRVLVGGAMGLSQAELLRAPERRLTRSEQDRLSEFVRRRHAREPVSRILGQRAFFGRDFTITPATLDPRPESEILIEAALEFAAERRQRTDRPPRVLDIGTGSGCLLVTLLAQIPDATGIGTDIDAATLQAAAVNAERHGVAHRAAFVLQGALDLLPGSFDILVSNPPYIPSADVAHLAPEVSLYDPRLALDGGPDGLSLYRDIARNLRRLVPEGAAFLEVGIAQSELVSALLAAAAGTSAPADLRQIHDLDGRERCVAWKARHTRTPTRANA
jgi:release factor glutamine methyltransferase